MQPFGCITFGDGCSLQGARRQEQKKTTRAIAQKQGPNLEQDMSAPRHVPTGRHEASRAFGNGQPRRHPLAWPAEAALSQPCAAATDYRALDRQVPTPDCARFE